ncbi:acyltransferase family protein [Microcoleus sp. F10-C6]|uniref:acyltransferase family protein n=1 Tax=unclassified Microcoleus TaxID=2642155 RepID=UPI002FD5B048
MDKYNLEKIYGFDYLRAICCIIVVGLHTNIFSFLLSYKSLSNIILYNIFCLAVPIFFQISLILFFLSRQTQKNYFFKKIIRIIKLYIFWGVISQIYLLAINEISVNQLINLIDIRKLIVFIMTDGYSNPFYFFFSLLFLTTLAELFAYYLDKTKINNALICYSALIFSCIIVFLLPLSVMFFGNKFALLAQHFNPLNFTPYIFSSFLIKNEISQNQLNNNSYINKKQLLLLIIFVVFAVCEWYYLDYPLLWGGLREDSLPIDSEDALPVYSRLSLIFGAWLIALIFLKITSEPHFILKLFSDLSLGIYCVHTLLGILLLRFFPSLAYANVLQFSIILLLSTMLTKFLKGFKILKDLI